MKKILVSIATCATLIITSGCTAKNEVGNTNVAAKQDTDDLVIGKTTYNEIITKYGNPSMSTLNKDGSKTIMYNYTKFQNTFNAKAFVPFLNLTGGATEQKMDSKSLSLDFNKKNILTDKRLTTSSH